MSGQATTPTDTRAGRNEVPAARRLHGADRAGLGDKGWAEVPDDRVGDPDRTNVPREYYAPSSEIEPDQPV